MDALTLDAEVLSGEGVQDLTTDLDEDGTSADLRARPLLAIAGSCILAFPRRIVCDRHELLDWAVSRHLRVTGAATGTYASLRASMLDHVVEQSLAQLMPGCRSLLRETWDIDGKTYERDVVVLFEDIAVCVETKAPQMVPSRRSSRRDVVQILTEDIAEGVSQVISIATALENGTAAIHGVRLPKVRRAYRLVASLNTWWGLELLSKDLHGEGVLPSLDAAILTCVEKFVCYESLFDSPADFIAYLDFRLMHQRRPWAIVLDEVEMIGGYFVHADDTWVHRPPHSGRLLVLPKFQDDFNRTLRHSLTGEGRRAVTMSHSHSPTIAENLAAWERARPRAWMQAFSALSRLSKRTQWEIERELAPAPTRDRRPLRKIDLPLRAGRLFVVDDPGAVDRIAWNNMVRNASTATSLVLIHRSTRQVLAVRGVDDPECWLDPAWEQMLVRRTRENVTAITRRGQRPQHSQRKRRLR